MNVTPPWLIALQNRQAPIDETIKRFTDAGCTVTRNESTFVVEAPPGVDLRNVRPQPPKGTIRREWELPDDPR